MSALDALEKTTRSNMLFDVYGALLTEKQRGFFQYYYHDDYSLGEIAAQAGVSRQAVYEHIKRADDALNEYEQKLGIVRRTREWHEALTELEQMVDMLQVDPASQAQQAHIHKMISDMQSSYYTASNSEGGA
jgi:predicted DNA-binding protein YlxM (UPF0122 family)